MNYLKSSSFRLNQQSYSWKSVTIYMLIAYIFSVSIRLILLYQMGEVEGMWDGNLPVPVWTPDAGRYGFYAKDILNGVILPFKDDYLLGHLIAIVTTFASLSIDWVMLLMPIFLGSLIVVPIILIGTAVKQPQLAFLATLITVSTGFYYVRTNLGYMDTDSINFFLILMGIAWIIKSHEHKSLIYATLGTFALILFAQWYHSATIINLLIFAITATYTLLFARKEKIALQTLIMLALAIAPIVFEMKLALLVCLLMLFMLFNRYTKLDTKVYGIVILFALVAGLFLLNPNHYIGRAMTYLTPAEYKTFSGHGIEYSYLNDLNFVGEVQKQYLWDAYGVPYISPLYVIVATIGYLLLLIAYPLLSITLPLIILGYLSGFAGVRFTIFATPILAFGFVYLLYYIGYVLSVRYKKSYYAERTPFYGTALILLPMIYMIFQSNSNAIMGLQFYKWEKKELASLGNKLDRDDTIVTWWEYGWPLWYYTGHDNTLTDNGYHGGPDMHFVAKLLLSDNAHFVANTAKLLSSYRSSPKVAGNIPVLPSIGQDYNLSTLLTDLSNTKVLSTQPKGDVYILLHQGMMSYFGTLMQFNNWDITKGKYKDNLPYYNITPLTQPFSRNNSLLKGYSYILDSSKGMVHDADDNQSTLNTLMITENNKRKEAFAFHKNSNRYMIVARGRLVWLDKSLYNSFYYQAMFMDVYDKNLFEKVAETKRMKIFRVK